MDFFKDDDGNMLQHKRRKCAVITCPAVNAGVAKVSAEKVVELMKERMFRILYVAQSQGNQTIILGAFGCGVFKNNPKTIAKIWKDLLDGPFFGVFEKVRYAPTNECILFTNCKRCILRVTVLLKIQTHLSCISNNNKGCHVVIWIVGRCFRGRKFR